MTTKSQLKDNKKKGDNIMKMFFNKFFANNFGKDDGDDEDMEFKPYDQAQRQELPTPPAKEAEPTASLEEQRNPGVELKVIRPEEYQEVTNVADNLIAGCTVVLNVDALDKHTIAKMLDFLNGVTYCLDGEIKKVAATTFIITPHDNVDITDM
jgi:cell division inhibitor SepF